ncbi:MAG: hypothetical protein HQK53_17085 [Oligoflexia bacterium]|nr:hypothetical protein [Oligoflexia bacterium]
MKNEQNQLKSDGTRGVSSADALWARIQSFDGKAFVLKHFSKVVTVLLLKPSVTTSLPPPYTSTFSRA